MSDEVAKIWDWGTAYDLFVSLHVLHEPGRFGLRPFWAAGVRSRLSQEDRDTLEQSQAVIWGPFDWVGDLPQPRDSAAVLNALQQMLPENRLPVLAQGSGIPERAATLLQAVASRGAWEARDQENLREAYQAAGMALPSKVLATILEVWAEAGAFGVRYLNALQAYREVFFAEEEERIGESLQTALAQAQERAEQIPLQALIEELSHGVRLDRELNERELVLAPSYWISPLVVFKRLRQDRALFLFGARPADVSLVPGEVVPEGMLRVLKTLGDPTRLRILRYLAQERITPAELARRLRLRAPTVTHHLNQLRLAGLVYLTLSEGERSYTARSEAVEEAVGVLRRFLAGEGEGQEPEC
jgi:DNA-binding transcriptional ArsR family regulator